MTESTLPENKAPITLFTIGFAGKSAEEFFTALRKAGVERLIDVRLNNVSQLAGFTKRRDCLLTVSLGGPWAPRDGSRAEACYKLIAAVIELRQGR